MNIAREYLALRAPLLEPGAFGLEIRGTVPPSFIDETESLLKEAQTHGAVQHVDGCIAGIVLDFDARGSPFYKGEILHIPSHHVREEAVPAHRTPNCYLVLSLVCILLALYICLR